MTLFVETFLELQEHDVKCHIEVGTEPQTICIERDSDPIWVEEVDENRIVIYAHSSEESFIVSTIQEAFDIIKEL
jgi:hypothetical protein